MVIKHNHGKDCHCITCRPLERPCDCAECRVKVLERKMSGEKL